MDPDLLTQIGLMLTQLRYARRALEDIERSTARYAGFAFASALSEGPAFGAPPLQDGALKVHVVNINDLAPGSSFGGFLESLLGGIGRFFGGLVGGFVGGTIGGFNVPGLVLSLQKLADKVERILTLLGLSFGDKDKKKPPEAGPPLAEQLKDVKDTVLAFTALFEAASDPDRAGKRVDPLTPAGERWLAILRTADVLVRGIDHVVAGLVVLIPILVGALASVIVHLRSIQQAILELVQFLLKEIFLLRGVVLFTLWDSLAGAAHLVASVLSILGGALQTIITALGGVFAKVFDAGLAILRFLADGLARTVDTLLRWLVDAVGAVLVALGDSKIFRVVVYLVQVLPALLPPLVKLVRDADLGPGDRKALEDAAKKTVEPPSVTGKLADLVPKFPDLKETLAPTTELAKLGTALTEKLDGVKADFKTAFGAGIGALEQIGKKLDEVKQDKAFLEALEKREETLRARSGDLAATLTKAQQAAAERPVTGLELIAKAYERWLQGDGLKAVLANIDAYFKEAPPGSAFGPPAPPTAVERPRATVEIKELVLELEPQASPPGDYPAVHDPVGVSHDPDERDHELAVRAFRFVPGALLAPG